MRFLVDERVNFVRSVSEKWTLCSVVRIRVNYYHTIFTEYDDTKKILSRCDDICKVRSWHAEPRGTEGKSVWRDGFLPSWLAAHQLFSLGCKVASRDPMPTRIELVHPRRKASEERRLEHTTSQSRQNPRIGCKYTAIKNQHHQRAYTRKENLRQEKIETHQVARMCGLAVFIKTGPLVDQVAEPSTR